MHRARVVVSLIASFVVMWAGGACAAGPGLANSGGSAKSPSASVESSTLPTDLIVARAAVLDQIEQTADRITAQARDSATRRNALLWKVRIVDGFQDAFARDEPGQALASAWLLAIRHAAFLRTGDGARMFGAQQALAVEAAADIKLRLENLATAHMTASGADELRKQLMVLAEQSPMTGSFAATSSGVPQRLLGALAAVPFAPLRAARGVGGGIDAVSGVPAAANRIGTVVEEFPDELRWQAELFLANVEGQEWFQKLIASIAQAASSSQRLATVAERWPQDVAVTSRILAADSRQTIADGQALLAQGRQLAAEGSALIDNTRALARDLEPSLDRTVAVAQAWEKTSLAVGNTISDIQTLVYPQGLPAPEATPSPDPDFLEKTVAAADALSRAAAEVDTTLGEVRQLIADTDKVRVATDAAMASATTRGEQLIDRAFVRGVWLLIVAFALMVAYHFICGRGRPRTGS